LVKNKLRYQQKEQSYEQIYEQIKNQKIIEVTKKKELCTLKTTN